MAISMNKYVDLILVMNIYKIILVVGILLIAMNCFRVLLIESISILENSTIDIVMLKKAKSLFLFASLAAWCMAIMISLGEKLYGFSTMFFVEFMFMMGMLFLTISVFSAIIAVVAWGRVIQEQSNVCIFQKLMRTSYIAALFLLLLSWIFSYHT